MKRRVFQNAEVDAAGLAEAQKVSHLSVSSRFKVPVLEMLWAGCFCIPHSGRATSHFLPTTFFGLAEKYFAFRFLQKLDALLHVWQNKRRSERLHYAEAPPSSAILATVDKTV